MGFWDRSGAKELTMFGMGVGMMLIGLVVVLVVLALIVFAVVWAVRAFGPGPRSGSPPARDEPR